MDNHATQRNPDPIELTPEFWKWFRSPVQVTHINGGYPGTGVRRVQADDPYNGGFPRAGDGGPIIATGSR